MTNLLQTTHVLPPRREAAASELSPGFRLSRRNEPPIEPDLGISIAAHRYARGTVRELPRIELDEGRKGRTW